MSASACLSLVTLPVMLPVTPSDAATSEHSLFVCKFLNHLPKHPSLSINISLICWLRDHTVLDKHLTHRKMSHVQKFLDKHLVYQGVLP
jgi:hypothetical protein